MIAPWLGRFGLSKKIARLAPLDATRQGKEVRR